VERTYDHVRILAMIDFCFDSLGNYNIGYPNLAVDNLSPDEFDQTYPRVLPLRLLMYLKRAGIKFNVHTVTSASVGSWYPVALGWHDFNCDYFGLMSDHVLQLIREKSVKILFYYHEGDHPGKIRDRFDDLCLIHSLPKDCYLFISSNSSADAYQRCRYFNDHEYFFSYINRFQPWSMATDKPRQFEFTALNRVHKWWRASAMADLHYHGILKHSLWSYNTSCLIEDLECNNPLELDSINGWRSRVKHFLSEGPYVCDTPNDAAHNDHRAVNTDLYLNSYCHLVIETLFDVDGSGGAFLTEKTFKCIKFGQPFVIIGPGGSLKTLRDQGYRVFDHAIDNSYDLIENNTERWLAVRETIKKIQSQDLHRWYLSCLTDVQHNQRLFESMAHNSLQSLAADLDTI
jgi:hypothetical protein